MTLRDLVFSEFDVLLKNTKLSSDLKHTFEQYSHKFKSDTLQAIASIIEENLKKGITISELEIKEITEIAFEVFLMHTKSYYDKMYLPHQMKADADKIKSRLLFFIQAKSDRATFMDILSKGRSHGIKRDGI